MLNRFKDGHIDTLSEALRIAEVETSNFFKLSQNQWGRYRYDIKTLADLKREEICCDAFAVLNRYETIPIKGIPDLKRRDFYFICLQDHRILEAIERDKRLQLLSLLLYIFTHELIHIVRFGRFYQNFFANQGVKEMEEKIVHRITYEVLRRLPLSGIEYVLDAYKNYRFCEIISN